MKGRTRHLLIAAVALVAIGAVTVSLTRITTKTDMDRVKLPSIDDVPGECWAKLAGMRIFFGHQSVGYNLIDGIADLANERDYIKLNVVQTAGPADFDRPILAHSQVGKNTDPVSKIEGFRNIMDAGIGNKADVAFFKFCYVDLARDSDPQEIFDRYRTALEDLKGRYPGTTFLHVTAPVRSAPGGAKKNLKECLKRLAGQPTGLDDNAVRERYNELLRNAYSGKEPIFDLALMETINPEGLRCYAIRRGARVPVMAPEYTDDGGHLNGQGRRRTAEQLLIVLAELAGKV
jgi:hypothetical protein